MALRTSLTTILFAATTSSKILGQIKINADEFAPKVGHSRAQGTFTRYRTVCNHIRDFLPNTYKREDIPLKELNLTFINDFEYFLRTEKKCRTNTVWGYMIVLKHIVSIARNDGCLPFNPFAGGMKL